MNDDLQPWVPSADDPFDLCKCGHLLRRAGYGAPLRLRQDLVQRGVGAALDAVLPPVLAAADDWLDELIALGDIERVRAFWVHRALLGEQPLRDRTAAFWHHHFATSNRKVMDPRAMALQFATFDRLGLGSFETLARAMVRDPALLRWLDNDSNVAGRPNENLARELFELFLLGRGAYGERDVQEAARALTGNHVRDGAFYFAARLHDGGQKDLLGQRGAFAADDVVALAVQRPESARFLAHKWLCWFVHPEPAPAEVEALAQCYLQNERHVGRTLRVLLGSRLFFSARAFRSKVKSPAEFVLGTVRLCGGRASPMQLAHAMGTMGELWAEPPSVEGWHGDRQWLSSATWLLRSNFALALFQGRHGKVAPAAAFAGLRHPEARSKLALWLLLDGVASDASRQRLEAFAATASASGEAGVPALLHAVTLLPEYQLL